MRLEGRAWGGGRCGEKRRTSARWWQGGWGSSAGVNKWIPPHHHGEQGLDLGSSAHLEGSSFPSRSEYREGGRGEGCNQINHPTPQNENRGPQLSSPPSHLLPSFQFLSPRSITPPTKPSGAGGRCFLSPWPDPYKCVGFKVQDPLPEPAPHATTPSERGILQLTSHQSHHLFQTSAYTYTSPHPVPPDRWVPLHGLAQPKKTLLSSLLPRKEGLGLRGLEGHLHPGKAKGQLWEGLNEGGKDLNIGGSPPRGRGGALEWDFTSPPPLRL